VSAITKQRTLCQVLFGLGILLVSARGSAKCPLGLYEVHGKVEHLNKKTPYAGVEVIGFFDDYRYAIGEQAKQPSRSIANASGEFVLRGAFDTYQEYSWWGHKCSREPERLEIIVISKDQGIVRLNYRRSELKILRGHGQTVVALPTIRLDN